ncbi:MAG: cell division protein ZapA [Clostridia bacterium]|nr:cell division protein ZapA [Clostridia bacterium]
MASKNKVEIRIAGVDYTLVGTESEEYLQKIGYYIDKKMNEIMRVNSKLSTSMAAVLTAINVADDCFKTRENEMNLKRDLKRSVDELERLRAENKRLMEENSALNNKAAGIQIELVKKEAELNEVRNSLNKAVKREGEF